jgi:Fe-S oxidoreductase
MHAPVVFAPVFVGALAFFAASCWRRFSFVTLGRPENRFDRPLRRTVRMLGFAIGQARVVRKPMGVVHLFIFWPFMLLLLENGEFLLNGLVPSLSFSRLPAPVAGPLELAFEVVSLAALAAVLFAVSRRLFFAPRYLESRDVKPRSFDAFLILSLIAVLMLTSFVMHGADIARGDDAARPWMPVAGLVAALLAPISPSGLQLLAGIVWWVHAAALLFFLNYLPFGKHMHILTAIPSTWFQSLERPNTQPRERFDEAAPAAPAQRDAATATRDAATAGRAAEAATRSAGTDAPALDSARFGASRLDDLTWKDLFDSLSCTECGRCQDACPAASTGKPLNPRQVVHDIKINLLANAPRLRRGAEPALPLIGDGGEGSVSEEALWSCTTCGACMTACPVFIEHLPKIVKLRRSLVERQARFPEELLNLFEGMEQRSNPWGIAPAERTKWCSQLPVKPFEAGKTEYLFYVGCAGAMDAHGKLVSASIARLLDAAEVSWGILGREEKCCGDSLRRLGNEYVFDRMARENVALLKEKGVSKIITYCPHCLSTLKNDYRQYGLELEVVHHTELLQQLLGAGWLPLLPGAVAGRTVYHDSCYLGRHNGIFDAPRDVVSFATGTRPLEMRRARDASFCCGAGGGRMWMEESLGTRINRARVAEALELEPDTVCVACPYCMTMFEDGLKDEGAKNVRVRDVAEVLAEALPKSEPARSIA